MNFKDEFMSLRDGAGDFINEAFGRGKGMYDAFEGKGSLIKDDEGKSLKENLRNEGGLNNLMGKVMGDGFEEVAIASASAKFQRMDIERDKRGRDSGMGYE